MNAPLRFHPYLRPMVWGGRRLGEVLRKPLPTADAYGESWEISDHVSHRSIVAGGAQAGRTLRDLMERERRALLGAPRGSPCVPLAGETARRLGLAVGPGPSGRRRGAPSLARRRQQDGSVVRPGRGAGQQGLRRSAAGRRRSGVADRADAREQSRSVCISSRRGPAIVCFCRRARFTRSAAAC